MSWQIEFVQCSAKVKVLCLFKHTVCMHPHPGPMQKHSTAHFQPLHPAGINTTTLYLNNNSTRNGY